MLLPGGCEVVLYPSLHSRRWIGQIKDKIQVNSDKNPSDPLKSRASREEIELYTTYKHVIPVSIITQLTGHDV